MIRSDGMPRSGRGIRREYGSDRALRDGFSIGQVPAPKAFGAGYLHPVPSGRQTTNSRLITDYFTSNDSF